MVHNNWVINLHSGEDPGPGDPFEAVPKGGKIMLNVDVRKFQVMGYGSKGWCVSPTVVGSLLWKDFRCDLEDPLTKHGLLR